jgi:hypothetical protein
MRVRSVPLLVVPTFIASLIGLAASSSPAVAILPICDVAIVEDPLGNTLLLTQDCETNHTIVVPDGKTLDGNGHSIFAVDPVSGDFSGAVVRNETTTPTGIIHVTNLTITGQLSIDQCDAGTDRLRGILLSGVGGTVTNTHLFAIRQGAASGCQEGNAIEVRNFFPDEPLSSSSRTSVTVSDNEVRNYQKTGILVNGNVEAVVARNLVVGDGPIDFIAQNGVQIGFGATALVSANSISGNNYTPNSFFACGIIVVDADGVDRKQQDNLFPPNTDPMANEKDTCGFAKGGNYEPFGD